MKKHRTFQDVSQTYGEVMREVLKDTTGSLREQIDAMVQTYYNGDYGKLISFKGQIAEVDGWGIGGGIQYEFSLTIEQLERLSLLKELK